MPPESIHEPRSCYSLAAMPPDPELVSALRAAVERDPDSLPLRLHLASMLLDLGAEAEALEQYAHVLQRDPANHRGSAAC